MSKISFKLLKTSKTSEERQIYVVHRFGDGDDFQRTTGKSIHPKYFDLKTGRASKVPNAPEINKVVQQLANDIDTAARNATAKHGKPTKEAVKACFDELLQQRKEQEEKDNKLRALKPDAERILGSYLESLYDDLRELEEKIAEKRKEIEAEELSQGIYKQMLVASYIDRYIEERKQTLAKNSIRLFPNVRDWVMKFNPNWRMDNVDKATLTQFQNFLIDANLKSGSIADIVTKLKSVVRYYASELKLDLNSFCEFKLGFKKKRNDNVVYLSKEQLEDLLSAELTSKADTMCRDVFCLMALTGVRWSDVFLKPEQIKGGRIHITTDKTDTDLQIPINPEAKEIQDRLFKRPDYKTQYINHFNKRIKKLCAQLPSFYNEDGTPVLERVKEYRGKNKADAINYVNKFDKVTCHTGRRTFINLALAKGVSPSTIASLVGHEGTELIMKTYSNKQVGIEKIAELLAE